MSEVSKLRNCFICKKIIILVCNAESNCLTDLVHVVDFHFRFHRWVKVMGSQLLMMLVPWTVYYRKMMLVFGRLD